MFKKVLEDLQFKKNIAETSRLFKEDPKNSKIFRNLSKGSSNAWFVRISVHKQTPHNKERKERKERKHIILNFQFQNNFCDYLLNSYSAFKEGHDFCKSHGQISLIK